ncbi:hypothetical protein GCM10009623_12360 [Nocardioides aestuarii]|uniref:PE domain-containing protein n=1 Tax=Nocardioides aestuarii TaxID=252231 RepID=A0ABW4TKC3_9ACTN
MGDRLSVDTEVLQEAGESLRLVATEFEHADDNSDRASEAVGNDDLADRVRDFAHNWNDRRGEMLGNIAALATAASESGRAFAELDRDLARLIRGEEV